jgi:CrcB protein
VDFLAVGLGGFLGAAARAWLANHLILENSGNFPFGTLIINLTGSFVLCFFMLITVDRLQVNSNLRLAVGTGFCGAYTTFSTFSLENINLLRDGRYVGAFAYIVITAFGCVLFGWLGSRAGGLIARKDDAETEG